MTAFGEWSAGHSFAPSDPGTPPEAVDDRAHALDAYDAASRALHRRKQVRSAAATGPLSTTRAQAGGPGGT
ncbi:hypothetical protein [Streptomyces cyaneofuscatus]|uniref:hypothetical protein n=1 Tax=Streptomyces cyaneofuscatus TaxID=66883 RepID=UPI0033A0F747